jgi:endoglucanase
MKLKTLILFTAFFLIANLANCQGFLKADGQRIVNEKGENVLLRGIGLGGWMLQEPYMFQLSDVARTQTEIKSKISDLIGQKNCDEFYTRYLNNMITEKDVDALK